MKKRKRRKSKKSNLVNLIVYLILAMPAIVLILSFLPANTPQPHTIWTEKTATERRTSTHTVRTRSAAIFDQLSVYLPNEELIERVRSSLSLSGYTVEIFSGNDITVDMYRELPSRNYGVILLRVHSTSSVQQEEDKVIKGAPVILLTGESYSAHKYSYEQLMGYVQRVKVDGGVYFGIGAEFVLNRMEGSFPNSLIIIAGCESMANKDLAKALVTKGASNVVGWSGNVDSDHNDKAIISLTRTIFEKSLPLAKAIETTMKEIGRDPQFQSFLMHYSDET
jgi:hypothetical protein